MANVSVEGNVLTPSDVGSPPIGHPQGVAGICLAYTTTEASYPGVMGWHLLLVTGIRSNVYAGPGARFAVVTSRDDNNLQYALKSVSVSSGSHYLAILENASETAFWMDSACVYTAPPMPSSLPRKAVLMGDAFLGGTTRFSPSPDQPLFGAVYVRANGNVVVSEAWGSYNANTWPLVTAATSAVPFVRSSQLWQTESTSLCVRASIVNTPALAVHHDTKTGHYAVAHSGGTSGDDLRSATGASAPAVLHGFLSASSPSLAELTSSSPGVGALPVAITQRISGELLLTCDSQGPVTLVSSDGGRTWA